METLKEDADKASSAAKNTRGLTSTTARAVQAAILSAGSFSLMFALIKLLGKGYPSGEILFSRSFFALIPLLPVIMRNGGLAVFRTQKPWKHAIRSTLGMISALLTIEAVKLLPLAEATALFYASPLVTTVLAVFLLNEKISKAKGAAIFAGFLGVVYMLQPRLSTNILGAALALAAAVSSGFVYIELRRMSSTEKSVTIVLYFMLTMAVAGILSMPFCFVMPNWQDGLLLLSIGVVGGVAQILMTDAYSMAPATTVAPLSYFSLLWAVLLDLTLWGRSPNLEALIGALIIALSGIFVVASGSASATDQNTQGQNAQGQNAKEKNPTQKNPAEKNPDQRNVGGKNADQKNVAESDTDEKNPLDTNTVEKESAAKIETETGAEENDCFPCAN